MGSSISWRKGLAHRRELVRLEPLALDVHQPLTQTLFLLEGLEQARAHLARACASNPHHLGLLTIRAGWLRGHDPNQVEQVLGELLKLQPANTWALRELALSLLQRQLTERALEVAEQAVEIAPHHPANWMALGDVLRDGKQRAKSREAFEKALELWPDMPGLIARLLGLCATRRERVAQLESLQALVEQRSVDGTALLVWSEEAIAVLGARAMLPGLQSIKKARPELWAGWYALGRARLLAGKADAAHTVLKKAVTRFPHVAQLWVELANVEDALDRGKRAVRAAKRARDIDPANEGSVLRLAGAYQRVGDLTRVEAVLRQGLGYQPRSLALRETLARQLWQAGEHELALHELERAITDNPEASEGWERLAEWCAKLEDKTRPLKLAQRLARERPWSAVLWLNVARVLAVLNENEASLAALDEAMTRDPALTDALVLRAMVLTAIGRKDEALEVCRRDVPFAKGKAVLRAREAWVHKRFDEAEVAIEKLLAVLVDFPDYVHGWRSLCEWYEQEGEYENMARAARKLVRLTPTDATAYGFLAGAELAQGQKFKAQKALFSALELSPSYLYAAEQLIHLSLQLGSTERARQALALADPHAPGDLRLCWSIVIEARVSSDRAFALFDELVRMPRAEPGLLESARRSLLEVDAGRLQEELAELAKDSDAHPEVGALWLHTCFDRGRTAPLSFISKLGILHPDAAQSAARALFDRLGERRLRFGTLNAVLKLQSLARRDDATWGKAGYALTSSGWYLLGWWWLKDHRPRERVEAWMLRNLQVCLLENHALWAARAVSERALELPSDATLFDHLSFVGFLEATAGDTTTARRRVAGVDGSNLHPFARWQLNATHALCVVDADDADEGEMARFELGNLARQAGFIGAVGMFWEASLVRRLARAALRHERSPKVFAIGYANWLVLAGIVAWIYLNGESPVWSVEVVGALLLVVYALRRVQR